MRHRSLPACGPLLALSLSIVGPGCAFHHYDAETGIEHIWGFGHLKMKVAPPEGPLQAVVHGVNSLGFYLGADQHNRYLGVGWQRVQYIDIHKRNSQFLLEWQGDDFTMVHVGFKFPILEPRPRRSEPSEIVPDSPPQPNDPKTPQEEP